MQKPVLIIMAAGMGSRYGGLKQIDPVDEYGNLIIDFSIYDAIQAGFEKIIFVIKREIEADFKQVIGNRISKRVNVEYVYQELDKLPAGYNVPEGRKKPWGTAHAVLCCKDVVMSPFAVINSDDYYGPDAYRMLYDYLVDDSIEKDRFGMVLVGYTLRNTLTENGYVSRGICKVGDDDTLLSINEITHIEKVGEDAKYTLDDGKSYQPLSGDSVASMNIWGFKRRFLDELEAIFPKFLDRTYEQNPLKGEYYLPVAVDEVIKGSNAKVQVLHTADKWYGVTYADDKPTVVAGIRKLKDDGVYPEKLWE